MKNILFITLLVTCFNTVLAQDKSFENKAKESYLSKNYTEAIVNYKKAFSSETISDFKTFSFELANCYYKVGNKKEAVKTIISAIEKYGVTEQDFVFSDTLDLKLLDYAWEEVYNRYEISRNRYLAYQQKK
jgi:tetratricopeptide (TPR) repeat protein